MNTQTATPVLIMTAAIIGAGMFGLPYAFAQAGFATGFFYMCILAIAVSSLHWMYAQIIVHTPGEHRLVGYSEAHLGNPGKYTSSILNITALYSAPLAYLLLGSIFFSELTSLSPFTSLIVSWLIFSSALLAKKRGAQTLEWVMSLAMMVLMVIIFFAGVSQFEPAGSFDPTGNHVPLLFSVILFSLYGTSAIPEIRAYLADRTFRITSIGTLIPMALYLLLVIGASGLSETVTPDMLSGITSPLLQYAGYGLGFIAIANSYWVFSTNLRGVLSYDFHLPFRLSTFLVLLLPLLTVLALDTSFLGIIDFAGSIAIGAEALWIIFLFAYMQWKRDVRFPLLMLIPIALIFISGIVAYFS